MKASHHISRKTTRFPPQCEMSLNSPAVIREQSRVPPPNLKGCLTSFWQLERFPEIPVATREEAQVSSHKSRRTPCSPPHLDMKADSPVSTREEPQYPCCIQEEPRIFYHYTIEGLTHLFQLKRNPEIPVITREEP